VRIISRFGFGFIECGSVTPKPQIGNDRPRIFRLEQERAVVNSLGFNNCGAEVFKRNISRVNHDIILGINLGKNKASEGINDYLNLIDQFSFYQLERALS
jgi:dihydroorotate dehydrogenase